MSKWDGKSKGTAWGYKFFIFFIKTFGLQPTYFILKFVTFYYFVFAKKNRIAIENFYLKTITKDKKIARKIARKNFYYFGQTLVDRYAFLLHKANKITYEFDNEKALVEVKNKGKGCVLLSAHLGNWEIAGNLLKNRVVDKMNALMLDEEYQKIKDVVNKATGGSKFNIIPIKNDFSHIIKIKNALNNNEFVAIHADRYNDQAKFIEVDFFEHKIKLPYGPFLIATKFNAPVVIVFAVKEHEYHYHFSSTNPIYQKETPEALAKLYIKQLEKMTKKYPEQWFNYYNYFE